MARADQPVDLHHLDRYTGGDRATNEEILQLFDDQCRQSLSKLEGLGAGGCGTETWLEIIHTLKGAARGIGAFDLGDAAAEAETALPANAKAELAKLKREADTVRRFIAEFLHTPA
ncbi:MAG TPA: Hpt domain-containing protein [Micropepsaceae bacterium]|nr:Hpt domain-containing protein [Micropepsaceae bacterium]